LDYIPGDVPCTSNLSLNSVPLQASSSWDLEPKLIEGSIAVNSSGHELVVSWFSACNSTFDSAAGSAAQVFTLLVKEINGTKLVSPAVAGLTISFKDIVPPQLIGYSLKPTSPVNIGQAFDQPSDSVSSNDGTDSKADDLFSGIEQLEAEIEYLKLLIKDKKENLHSKIRDNFYEELGSCDGCFCKVKVFLSHVHNRVNNFVGRLFTQTKSSKLKYSSDSLHRVQATAMIPTKDGPVSTYMPEKPEKCHCKEESIEEPPFPEELPPRPGTGDNGSFRTPKPVSKWARIIHVFTVISGIALLIAIFRCCCSPRRRRDRAARKEQLNRERAYKRSERRQRFWDYIRGNRRGRPGRRVTDLDEKRGLVDSQEAMLEEAMQDEIRQLEIHEEIRELKSTRDAVDELIRAEEGRSGRYVPPRLDLTAASSSNLIHYSHHHDPDLAYLTGFAAIKHSHAIPIPRPTHTSGSDTSRSEMSFSPASRTTSLPSYRSKPPSYRERESSDEDSDRSVTTDDIPESDESDGEDARSGWGSESSLPDFSPRPSAETIRTMEEVGATVVQRTFV
jgi:hypothetical protein